MEQDRNSPELLPDQCVAGRYRIIGVLGTGGMATVYKAHDLQLKRDVALKVVLPELRRNGKTLQRFMREAQSMASLDSPYVVPVYDVGREGELNFMVMKLVDAPPLSDLIERGPLSEKRSLALVTGVLEGLRDLHARGIVHRDVKPSNIVVEGDRPMLLDFGIALELGEPSLTQEGSLVGTPHYMAPEQIFTPTNVDGRADLYAVGVVFFEILTGRLPYRGSTPTALMQSHLTSDVPDPCELAPHLSKETAAAVRRALTKDPEHRFQSADEFLASLRSIERPKTLEPEALLPEAKHDQLILGMAGVVLLVLAAFVMLVLIPDPTPEPIVARVRSLPNGDATPVPRPIEAPIAPPVLERPVEVKPTAPVERRRPRLLEKPTPYRAALPARDPEVKRAQATLEKGDVRGAIRALTAVIQRNPSSPEPYATLGDAYAFTGNKIAAIAAYRRYLALSPRGECADRVEAALSRLGGHSK